jgi:hypothetical protein
MRRAGAVVGMAVLAVCLAPGVASADVLFDPADAEALAATLDEAYQAQGVCYGWSVTIDNVGSTDESVGSNFGAGRPVTEGNCGTSVEFTARITWTSESSESEDSGSYSVFTDGGGRPDTSDLDSLELISVEGLIGDNGDAEVYKAVSALPLLAADAGLADPIEATPAPEGEAGPDAQPTNSPSSDFWRNNGMMILWGSVILIAGGVFAWWVIRTDRRRIIHRGPRATGPTVLATRAPVGPSAEQIPAYVPEDWSRPAAEPEQPGEPEKPADDPESPPEPASEDDPDRTDGDTKDGDTKDGDTKDDPPEASSPDEPPRPKS